MSLTTADGGKGFRADLIEVTCNNPLDIYKKLVEGFNKWQKENSDRIVTSVFPPNWMSTQKPNGEYQYNGHLMFFHGPVY